MYRIVSIVIACVTMIAFAVGCEKSPSNASQSSTTGAPKSGDAAAPALPATLFLATAPSEVQEVKAAKAALKQGDAVTVRGRIGGSVDPFVSGRAVFTIVDKSMPACSDNPDDGCETPWDYCCETRADIVAHAATVQVVDAAGQPLKIDVKDASGLKPLTEVIIVGTVAHRDDAGNFVINASGVFVGG